MNQSNISEWPRRLLWYLENRFLSRWRLTTLWPVDSEASVQRSLLRLLAVAQCERLDEAVLVKNFADEHRGMWKYRLRRLAKRIESGTSLVNALEYTPDVLSPSQVLAIRFATQSGTLDRTYKQLLEHPIDNQLSTFKRASVYGFSVLIVIVLVLQFLSTFIVPTLAKISDEFGVVVPPVMQSFMDIRRQVESFGGLLSLLIVALACGLLLSSIRRRIMKWISPWWTRISTQSRSAELLRMLAISADAGRPLAGSLSVLARYHFDREVRSRLLFARNEVEQGAEPWECLERARFLNSAEADAIRSASDLRLQAWTLNQIAIAKSRTLAQRGRLAALAMPAVTILASAVVLWVAIAFIQHLAKLIQSLA
jgi:general secretion pathway protein F